MHRLSPPRVRLALATAGAAVLLAIAAAAVAAGSTAHTTPAHHHATAAASTPTTAKAMRFHDGMRKLWEDHITWTRLAIVSFAAGSPDLPATEARLLNNQSDIAAAIRPYYGQAASTKLRSLLRAHILGAVALLQAAKANDSTALTKAHDAWYANGNDIADFLSSANPHNWPRGEMRSMMKEHLDVTLKEAVDQLNGRFAAGVADYDSIHAHILEMADQLSSGIIAQFPSRFR
jgi:hypothetical protein